jgi:FkbM family methyltransferase
VLAEIIRTSVKPGDLVIDRGANAGRHSINFLRALAGRGKCIAIEPNPAMVDLIRQRLAGHTFEPNLHLLQAAVGDKIGTARFNVFDTNPALSRMLTSPEVTEYAAREITVDVIRMDDIPRAQRVAFIKIDVEGHEIPALLGARQILKLDQPFVFFECNIGETTAQFGAKLFDIFDEAGYTIWSAAGQSVSRELISAPLPTNFFAAPKGQAPAAAEVLHFAVMKAVFRLLAGERLANV